MNKQELIEEIKRSNEVFPKTPVLYLIEQLDEPQPLKLKDIISRMKQLFPLSRSEWIDEILKEFGEELFLWKYKAGYEQGKLEGIVEREKVTIPQFVADWIEYCKIKKISLAHALYRSDEAENKSVYRWIVECLENQETFARAWLDGYEVEKEKEKRYEVILCNGQSLKTVYRQGDDYLDFENVYGDLENFTRKQLEDANFGWVFDCEGVEVEEVEG